MAFPKCYGIAGNQPPATVALSHCKFGVSLLPRAQHLSLYLKPSGLPANRGRDPSQSHILPQ